MGEQKYRQRGYQDSARRGGPPSGSDERPGRMEGAPKGRGAERDRAEVFRCKRCGEKAAPDFPPDALCKKCGDALHACVQCRSFDTLARFQCVKPIPALITGKSSRNDCAFFEPSVALDLKGTTALGTPDQARNAFDKLFGKR